MLPQALAIPALILVIFIFILSAALLQSKQDNGKQPPGPKTLPIIGNLHMLGKLPHRTLQSLATKYGPIMSLKLGQVTTIMVSSPEAAELFLKTYDISFASRSKTISSKYISYGGKGLVFSEYGTYWRSMRKLCTIQLLTASRVEMFSPLRSEQLGEFVKFLQKTALSREVVDLSNMVGDLIENITFKMILGCNNDDRFNVKNLVREVMNLVGTFNVADYVPWLRMFDFQVPSAWTSWFFFYDFREAYAWLSHNTEVYDKKHLQIHHLEREISKRNQTWRSPNQVRTKR